MYTACAAVRIHARNPADLCLNAKLRHDQLKTSGGLAQFEESAPSRDRSPRRNEEGKYEEEEDIREDDAWTCHGATLPALRVFMSAALLVCQVWCSPTKCWLSFCPFSCGRACFWHCKLRRGLDLLIFHVHHFVVLNRSWLWIGRQSTSCCWRTHLVAS